MKKVLVSALASFVLTLVVIFSFVPAVNACPLPPVPPSPTPSPTPVIPSSDYVPDGAEFELVVCDWTNSWKRWEWAGGYWDGHVLGEDIDQIGSINGQTLRVIIPKGTIINEHTTRAFLLFFGMIGDDAHGYSLWIEPKTQIFTFSNPVSIYSLSGETWLELVEFNYIANGIPSLKE